MFKTIEENVTAEIVEKKSKFIGNLYYVENVAEAEELIKQANKKYFDARHNCYAFCVMTENGMVNRFSDDGEPSGTAGGPMLNVLTSQNLGNVLVIVTRYFGGILLGTGGLVKAYTMATMEALEKAKLVFKDWGLEIAATVDYPDLEKFKYYLKQTGMQITDIAYEETVKVVLESTKESLEKMLEQKENLNFRMIKHEVLREKCIRIAE